VVGLTSVATIVLPGEQAAKRMLMEITIVKKIYNFFISYFSFDNGGYYKR
jgi:hypothetical protein